MKRLILASSSPRRLEILSKFDIDIKVIASDIEEHVSEDEKPHIVVMSLAMQKALDVLSKTDSLDIVVGADTIVYNGHKLGKPKSKEEAYDMLRRLSGKKHSVYTGLAVLGPEDTKIVDYVETKVEFKNVSDEDIQSYLRRDEYRDKAGSYAIQGLSSIFVKRIEGSYSNVVGLPISMLDDILKQYFKFELLS
ncbi:Maf family protein [Clostridiaceae bacterium M8S5]|nr:Maf family protein [Clostridiaceae bacterium M8S5]